jgi:hypothetical protein
MKKRMWAALVAVSLFPAVAYAQPQPGAAAGSADEQTAQSLSDQAYAAYEKNDFAKAVELYLSSYKLVPTADILYNVASIYDKKLNEPKTAVEYYRRYNAAPDAKPDLVGKSTARIATLSSPSSGGSSSAEITTDRSSAANQESGNGLRVAGVVTGIVGIVGLGIGGVTGLVASGKHDDSKCTNNICPDEPSKQKEKDAASMATVSTVSFIAGGVLLAAGIVMYLVAPKSEKRSAFLLPTVGGQGGPGWNAVIRF